MHPFALIIPFWIVCKHFPDPPHDCVLRYLCLSLSHVGVTCRGHLDAILDMVQASLSYDPNYADDMEEDEDEDGEEDEDE